MMKVLRTIGVAQARHYKHGNLILEVHSGCGLVHCDILLQYVAGIITKCYKNYVKKKKTYFSLHYKNPPHVINLCISVSTTCPCFFINIFVLSLPVCFFCCCYYCCCSLSFQKSFFYIKFLFPQLYVSYLRFCPKLYYPNYAYVFFLAFNILCRLKHQQNYFPEKILTEGLIFLKLIFCIVLVSRN